MTDQFRREGHEQRAQRYFVTGFFALFVPLLLLALVLIVRSFYDGQADPSSNDTPAELAAEIGDVATLDDLAPLSEPEREGVSRIAARNAQIGVLEWLNSTGGYEAQLLIQYVFDTSLDGSPETEERIETGEQLRADGADLCAPLPLSSLRRADVDSTEALARLTSEDLADWFTANC